MRRSLAGLLFGLAAILGSLAVSGFWLQQTAFSPEHTRGAAKAVLEDTDIRNEVATLIANATAAQLPEIPPVELQARIVRIAESDAGAVLLADIIGDAHARLIGERDTPVQVTSQELVEVVRDERAFVVPTITLDVPQVTALSIVGRTLTWLVPIAAGLAVLLIVLGFAAHPEKAEMFQSLALLLFGIAILLSVIGYALPSFVVPLFSDSVWINALPRLARSELPMLVVLVLVFLLAGLASLFGAAATKRRDRWSQPLRRSNYREERRWT